MMYDVGGDGSYTVIPPNTSPVVQAGVEAISRYLEAQQAAAREETRREIIKIEAEAALEKFRTAMAILEDVIKRDDGGEQRRVDHFFAMARLFAEQGKDQAALAAMEMMSKEGRISMVQKLIDYHREVTLKTINIPS